VNFELYRGEVLGIAGMLGSGRTELLRGIFGADPVDSGEVVIEGKAYKDANPIKMVKAGVGLTPENRKTEGLILIHSIRDNLCYASMNVTADGWIENKRKRNTFAEKQVRELEIKIPTIDAPCSSLSGGNQQKVVVGNWLNTGPKVMLYDEPSRGIDVNAKQQVFEIMWAEARKGISSIFVSTELEELLEVCHRILIMRDGKIVDEVNPDKLNTSQLYELCMRGD
jgi:ABC-type sugar transport system ATPase subunit